MAGLRPAAGGTPAIPGEIRSAWGAFLGARASCPLQHTGGPAAGRPLPASGRGRARRPRSQGKSAPLGGLSWERGHLARFNTPLGLRRVVHCRPPAGGGRDARDPRGNPLRLGGFPGSAGILPASTHRWACGGSSIAGLRPGAGATPAIPGEIRSAWGLSRERGHLARFNTPVGLRRVVHCRPPAGGGRDARDPSGKSAPLGGLSWERGHLARFNTPVGLRRKSSIAGLRPGAGGTPAIPGEIRSAWGAFLGARASCPLQHTGGPSAGRPLPASGRGRAGRPRSQGACVQGLARVKRR